jgi:Zn-dependent protease with chaperone function
VFGNFIYFIVVLLITLTYQPSEQTHFSATQSGVLFIGLSLAFAVFTRLAFKRIEQRIGRLPFARLDQQFHAAQMRASIAAVAVYALDIYALNLPSFLFGLTPLDGAPTLETLLFLLLFMGYLGLAWALAFDVYRKLYHPDFGRRAYVASNVSFSIPVLLPWLLLSGLADLLNALPFEGLRRFLATSEGQFAYFALVLVAIAVVGPFVIQRFWRCYPLESGDQRRMIDALCRRAGMAYADILYWPLFGGKMITAGVMGLVRRFRYILVTPALLGLLEPDEVEAVVAHEIGHIKKKHLVFYLLFFAGYVLFAYVSFDLLLYGLLYLEPVWRLFRESGINQSTTLSTLFSVLMIAVFLVYFRFIFGFFMRNFERQADTYVFTLFESARPLVETLRKIAVISGQSPDRPNWHHFSIRERIDYLGRCEQDRAWIRRHDTKVRRGIASYLAVLVFFAVVGYQLNLGALGQRLSGHVFEAMLERELQKSPDDAGLHALRGDLEYSRSNYPGVIAAYERSLMLKPDSAQVLNNLAWLLATCEDRKLRDPVRALELAERAAALEPSAHILDTLAESYFANGRYAEAVATETRALEKAGGDRGIYERQLQKFIQARDQGGSSGRSTAN